MAVDKDLLKRFYSDLLRKFPYSLSKVSSSIKSLYSMSVSLPSRLYVPGGENFSEDDKNFITVSFTLGAILKGYKSGSLTKFTPLCYPMGNFFQLLLDEKSSVDEYGSAMLSKIASINVLVISNGVVCIDALKAKQLLSSVDTYSTYILMFGGLSTMFSDMVPVVSAVIETRPRY